MASAQTLSTAAAANAARIPDATASGCAAVMSFAADANANRAPIADAPVRRPRWRDRPSIPAITPRCSGPTCVMIAVLLAAWNTA